MTRGVRISRRARIAGVDEAGRGPLAGPVVAAAVILNARRPIAGLADSKVLPPEERRRLALLIRTRSLAWGIGWSDSEEIDSLNILQADAPCDAARALVPAAVSHSRAGGR